MEYLGHNFQKESEPTYWFKCSKCSISLYTIYDINNTLVDKCFYFYFNRKWRNNISCKEFIIKKLLE
jgi:hypothetical protein